MNHQEPSCARMFLRRDGHHVLLALTIIGFTSSLSLSLSLCWTLTGRTSDSGWTHTGLWRTRLCRTHTPDTPVRLETAIRYSRPEFQSGHQNIGKSPMKIISLQSFSECWCTCGTRSASGLVKPVQF